jgi:putative transcriptional regulator
MDFDNPEQLCLNGSLILADPSLRDAGFRKGVLLLTNHAADEGAMGFIMNKPIRKKVKDLIDSDKYEQLQELDVFLGGPVCPDELILASFAWNAEGEVLDFSTHLSPDAANHRMDEGFEIRAFVGYSGWSEGQLESELQQRAWITTKASELVLDSAKCEEMWSEILTGMGPYYRLLANAPDDFTLN